MKINIRQLKEGMHDFEFTAYQDELDLEAHRFANAVNIHSVVDKRRNNIFVNTSVNTEAHFECHRCLTAFTQRLEDSFELLFTFEERPAYPVDMDEDEIIRLGAEVQEIDLTQDVRDCMLLAIPIKVVCSQDCRGLCSRCGANLNHEACTCSDTRIDPRWEALRALLQ